MKGWTGAKGGAGGLTTTEIRKEDFQPDDSKGTAWGDVDKQSFCLFFRDVLCWNYVIAWAVGQDVNCWEELMVLRIWHFKGVLWSFLVNKLELQRLIN